MNPDLKIAAEKKDDKLGFSSLQEMIRVILTQLTQVVEVRVDDICIKYGISYLGLFGSMARGEVTDSSDVDLLVKFSDKSNIGLFALDQIQHELEMRVGRKVDLITKMNRYISGDAMKDMKTLYEG